MERVILFKTLPKVRIMEIKEKKHAINLWPEVCTPMMRPSWGMEGIAYGASATIFLGGLNHLGGKRDRVLQPPFHPSSKASLWTRSAPMGFPPMIQFHKGTLFLNSMDFSMWWTSHCDLSQPWPLTWGCHRPCKWLNWQHHHTHTHSY